MTKLRAVAHLGFSGGGWTESKKKLNWTGLKLGEEGVSESSLTSLKPRMAYLVNITALAERDFASL
jgi:hypothetical protein